MCIAFFKRRRNKTVQHDTIGLGLKKIQIPYEPKGFVYFQIHRGPKGLGCFHNGSSHTFNQFVVKILMSEQLRISDHAIIHAILSQNPPIKYTESLIVEMILFILYC